MSNAFYHKKTVPRLWIPVVILLLLAAIEYRVLNASVVLQTFHRHQGIASWYSEHDKDMNKMTAAGEIFDDTLDTCASWDHPLGSRVIITNIQNGKSVVCRVNDRGPDMHLDRIVDMTKASFGKIADLSLGLIKVTVERV